jgi:hypothetical protein
MRQSRFTESQIVNIRDYNERRPMTRWVGHPVHLLDWRRYTLAVHKFVVRLTGKLTLDL